MQLSFIHPNSLPNTLIHKHFKHKKLISYRHKYLRSHKKNSRTLQIRTRNIISHIRIISSRPLSYWTTILSYQKLLVSAAGNNEPYWYNSLGYGTNIPLFEVEQSLCSMRSLLRIGSVPGLNLLDGASQFGKQSQTNLKYLPTFLQIQVIQVLIIG